MSEIIIEYKDKKNSSATIRDGQIILRISNNLPKIIQQQHIKNLLNKLQPKVEQHSNKKFTLKTGTCIEPYGLTPYWLDISYSTNSRTQIQFDSNQPIIKIKQPQHLTSDELKHKISDQITKKLEPLLKKYIHELNTETVQQEKLQITFRNLKAKWGYCQAKRKTICLSKKLFWLPKESVDYIIIHELCHFVEQNHSADFWNQVAKYCPDYKKINKQLHYWQ